MGETMQPTGSLLRFLAASAMTGRGVPDRDSQVPFPFAGTIDKVTIALDRPRLTPEDEKKLTEAQAGAADAK
jgi:hypothetical protein